MNEEHEEQLASAFLAFTKLERTLRQVVGETLSKHFGMQWAKQIPTGVREHCETKMQESSQVELGPEREKNLLAFADFSQLTAIVEYHWEEVFRSWFSDKQFTMGRFEEIRQYRNALMHSVLLPKQCPIFISLCQRLIEQLEAGPKEVSSIRSLEAKPDLIAQSQKTTPIPSTEEQNILYQKILVILGEMTGLFEAERDALLEYVEHNLDQSTPALLEHIRCKFINLPDTNNKVDALANRLPPKRPELPNSQKWGLKTSEWFKWAVNSYLPYRYWMITNNKFDEEIETMSQIYEDWLYKSYPKLLNRPDQFVYGTYQRINQLLERHTVLWVIIDNLPFFFSRMLTKHLAKNGLRVTDMVKQLAMLPSETAISRKCALAGRLPNQIRENLNETDALQEAWRNRTNKRVVVLEKLNDLENIDQQQAELFIYVYGRLDKLGHTPNSKDFEREAEIDAALARLVGKIQIAMTQLTQITGSATLVISTDHGSTYLQQQSKGLSVPPSAIEDVIYEEHRRFIRTSRQDSLNSTEWFYLNKDQFGLHYDFAVARGWRYLGSRPQGFTHGGLSPEETLVPMFICELGKDEYQTIQLSYEQATEPLRLGRPSKLAVRVRNPYRMPIEGLEITLSDYGQTFSPIDIDPQLEVATETIEFTLPAKLTVEQETIFINITVLFMVRGQKHSQMTKLRLKVRQLFKTDLDDDFGAMF